MSALMTLQGTLQQWQLVSHANQALVCHSISLSLLHHFLLRISSLSLSVEILGVAGIGEVRGSKSDD